MALKLARAPRARDVLAPAVLALLLAGAQLAGESDLVAALQGKTWFEGEIGQARMHGYYEHLIEAAPAAGRRPDRGALAADVPPHGSVIFQDAGIIDESPTYLRWRMRPGLDVRWNGTAFRTNRFGHRTPEVAERKPPGTYRIVLFGSSNTMGHGVDDGDCYARHLERWLNEELGRGRRVEVLNLAVSGDSPTRRLERIRAEAGRFDPDWLLCDASALDYFLEEVHLQAVVAQGIPVPFPFVREILERSGITAADPPEAFRRKLRGEFERLLDGAYAGWAAEARRLGVPMTVVILPRSDHKAKATRVFRLTRSIAERNGLDCLDLSGEFRDLEERRLHASAWDKHPSALGHFVIFDALRAALRRRGGLPGLPFSRDAEPSVAQR